MKEYLPQIQEVLRRDGFPNFNEDIVQELFLAPEIKTERRERWLFSNKGKTATVVLTRDFVVFECSRYSTFEDFTERFQKVLSVLAEKVEVELSEQIGLRYVNLIRHQEGSPISAYLKPGLAGLTAAELGAKAVLFRAENNATTEHGQLALRVVQTDDGTFLPPGLDARDLAFDVDIDTGDKLTIFDIDHYSPAERDFKASDLIEEFWKLHDYTDRAFRAAVTDDAMQHWRAMARPKES